MVPRQVRKSVGAREYTNSPPLYSGHQIPLTGSKCPSEEKNKAPNHTSNDNVSQDVIESIEIEIASPAPQILENQRVENLKRSYDRYIDYTPVLSPNVSLNSSLRPSDQMISIRIALDIPTPFLDPNLSRERMRAPSRSLGPPEPSRKQREITFTSDTSIIETLATSSHIAQRPPEPFPQRRKITIISDTSSPESVTSPPVPSSLPSIPQSSNTNYSAGSQASEYLVNGKKTISATRPGRFNQTDVIPFTPEIGTYRYLKFSQPHSFRPALVGLILPNEVPKPTPAEVQQHKEQELQFDKQLQKAMWAYLKAKAQFYFCEESYLEKLKAKSNVLGKKLATTIATFELLTHQRKPPSLARAPKHIQVRFKYIPLSQFEDLFLLHTNTLHRKYGLEDTWDDNRFEKRYPQVWPRGIAP